VGEVANQGRGNHCAAFLCNFAFAAACLCHESFTFDDCWYGDINGLDCHSRQYLPGTNGFLLGEAERLPMLGWRYRLFEVTLGLAKIKYYGNVVPV
jgi:hypothetical protein